MKILRDLDLYRDGCCVYELDGRGEILRLAAWAPNALTARAAFDQLVAAYPDQAFSCRRRGWVQADHFPPESPPRPVPTSAPPDRSGEGG